MFHRFCLLPLLLAGSALAAPQNGPTCAAVVKALPAMTCRQATAGVVLSTEPAEIERLAAASAAGAERFRRYFGAAPPAWALIQGGTGEERALLKSLGARRTLPWPTSAQSAEAASASIARGAEAQAKAQGLSGERLAAVVAQAKAQWAERNPPSRRYANEGGAIPHELGHLWLIERFWPGGGTDAGGHYGGPGPDWLDETAAVLMEDETMTASRRQQFWKGIADDPTLAESLGVTSAALLDLDRFFAEAHPMQATQGTLRPRTTAIGMTVLTGEEARRLARGAVIFYLQSRLFADWALAQSGNEALFGEIATALGRGQTFDAWLARNGARNRIGRTRTETATLWRAWVQANRPKA